MNRSIHLTSLISIIILLTIMVVTKGIQIPCCHDSFINSESCKSLKTTDVEEVLFAFKSNEENRNSSINDWQFVNQTSSAVCTLHHNLRNDGESIFTVENDSLKLSIENHTITNYSRFEYCVKDTKTVKLCKDNLDPKLNFVNATKVDYYDCSKRLCVSKCCPEGHLVTIGRGGIKCAPFKDKPKPLKLNFKYPNGSEASIVKPLAFLVQFPFCTLYKENDVSLLPNGALFLPSTDELFGKDSYCLDFFNMAGNTSLQASVCSKKLIITPEAKVRHTVHVIGFFISCIFLAVTFTSHILTPKLRDMQGRCFMSYVGTLFCAFLLLIINRLIPKDITQNACVVLAVLNHFALLSAFFWLNVMSFDIWRIIRGTVHTVRIADLKIKEKRLFILYSLYSYGVPFIISLVTFIIHVIPDEKFPDYFIKPEFTTQKCWFSDDTKVLFAYYHGIIAILFVMNIALLIHTSVMLQEAGVAFMCCRFKSSTAVEGGELRVSNRVNLSTFWHRFCLFSIMAVCWTTEVLSFIPPRVMWVFTDVLNTLQGLFIFILFIRSAKKRTLLADAWKNVVVQTKAKKTSFSNCGLRAHFINHDTTHEEDLSGSNHQVQFINKVIE